MADEEMRFDDQVVIVTGAGRGLGREYALAFAARGAAVLVNDPSRETGGERSVAEAVVSEIIASGGRAVADMNSVATRDGARAIVAAAISTFGAPSILINNAGIIDYAPFDQLTVEAWQRMMDVTLGGAFHMTQAVWPYFVEQRHGRIVNTTSNVGFAGNADLVHYGAAKLGVAGFTRTLAQEAAPLGIMVNAVAPMAITRMNRDAFFGGADAGGDDWVEDIRSGRAPMGPPSMVAPTVLWLAHPSTQLNGEIFSVSSGKVARVGFVVGQGFFDPNHSPEDIRGHSDLVRDIANFFEPRACADEIGLIPALFHQT